MDNPFQDAVVVSTYTDREACEDGILVPISAKDRVSRAVWEYLVDRGPKGNQPPNRWPVEMLGWFQASKMSKPEALALIAEHGTEEANKRFARMIADRKALALSKGIISTHARQAARVYEENTDGGIYKLFSLETAEGITELAAADPGERSGKTVLWLLPNEKRRDDFDVPRGLLTMIVKRAVKREPGYPPGVPAPLYLDCECGHHLNMPYVKGLPIQAYVCLCGREYDTRGWLLKGATA